MLLNTKFSSKLNNRLIIVLVCMLFSMLSRSSYAQVSKMLTDSAIASFKKPKKPKVMILGTFHFNDGGLDAYKPKFPVNIKSTERQKEVQALVQLLAKFKPTKVTIEQMVERQPYHDSLYNAYLNNTYTLGANEIFQVSYRLAGLMGHKKVYTIDAPARMFEPDINVDSFIIANKQQLYKDSIYTKLYFSLYALEDSLKSVGSLKESLARINEPNRLNLGLGHYLIGDFKAGVPGNYVGADAAIYWWSRNLRIFSNILQLAAQSPDERIFVLIGAGHLSILRFLALCTPEIEFVDANDYLIKE